MKIMQECGQRWYRFSSWFPRRKVEGEWRRVLPKFRRLRNRIDGPKGVRQSTGWAFGPIMIYKKERG